MELQDLTNILINNGVTVAVLVYFIWRDYKFMDTLKTTLVSLINTVDSLKDCISEMKSLVIKEGGN
mgnify:CR=1 FL=1